ncbi:MAG: pathogenicity locus [Bacteroidales bacterium]|nr:pathogenicity locus [Bacteroidales bacterium]
MKKKEALKDLIQIPGIGKSLANNLMNISIYSVNELKKKDPEMLYDQSNKYAGTIQDRCVLYVFRCAVYYANTDEKERNPEKLKWWNWKDKK